MLIEIKSYAKFFVKSKLVRGLRNALLYFFSSTPENKSKKERILLICLQSLGDLIIFTSVLQHYKKRYPEAEIYLLTKAGLPVIPNLKESFVDEVVPLPYAEFVSNPWTAFKEINKLRKIGFTRVIAHDPSAPEINGRDIATLLGAEEVIGYRGQAIEWNLPFDIQQKKNLEILKKEIFPKFTKIIPSLEEKVDEVGQLPSYVEHHIHVFEEATGSKMMDYSLSLPESREEKALADARLESLGVPATGFVVVNINGSSARKRWPLDRFKMLVDSLISDSFCVVLIGARGEVSFTKEFEASLHGKVINLAGQIQFNELIRLIERSILTITNDTFAVHVAVATKRPSLTLTGGWLYGAAVNYGYEDINRWIGKRTPCYFDNWRCNNTVPVDSPAPCMDAIDASRVIEEARELLQYLRTKSDWPRSIFLPSFPPKDWPQKI